MNKSNLKLKRPAGAVRPAHFIPLLIGLALGLSLGGWWGFLVIFPWIGGCVSAGIIISALADRRRKQLGRRIAILAISPIFIVFLGMMQRENLQIEEAVFYTLFFLSSGVFTRVLIHYAIAKIIGPLIWGRGFCGWACWTAALMEWLPIRENRPIPKRYTWARYPALAVSIILPLAFVWLGYDWYSYHIYEDGKLIAGGKPGALAWFAAGNLLYYSAAVVLAFKFRKRRAFCKIACPVSLLMKPQSRIALLQPRPGANACVLCNSCNKSCPMDVDVAGYISRGKRVSSSECIHCGQCAQVCPQKAIS
jgi:polyferredoxin